MISVVLGMGFGDEGKGTVVDYLTHNLPSSLPKLIVRFSGGPQAGHTVMYKNSVGQEIKHTFSNFGSGSFNSNTKTFWSRFCPVDPVGFLNERNVLIAKGIVPLIIVDQNCPLITDFDKHHNQNLDCEHGTCGVGIRSTLVREEKLYSLKVKDILYPNVFKQKYLLIAKHYGHEDVDAELFYNICQEYFQHIQLWKSKDLPFAKYYIFEGSQGLLLDPKIGFFPHVTSTDVDLTNVYTLIGKETAFDLYLVTRAYSTRHGNGPMVYNNSKFPFEVQNDKDEINISNLYQGNFRRQYLNLEYLNYAIDSLNESIQSLDIKTQFVITCIDQMKRFIYFDGIQSHEHITYLGFCTTLNLHFQRRCSTLCKKEILINISPFRETMHKII